MVLQTHKICDIIEINGQKGTTVEQIQVKLLGTPWVRKGGENISFPYKKVDAFLYYLLVSKEVSRGDIAQVLWENLDEEAGWKNLRHVMYSLRQKLGCDLAVRMGRENIGLNPEIEISCDLWDFLQKDQVDLYEGAFLSGFSVKNASRFEQLLEEQRNYLQHQYLKKLLARGQRYAQEGNLDCAVADLERYLQREPLDETAISALMNLHRSQKRFHRAVDLYNQLCTQLSSELSLAPLKETTLLYYEIVNQWNSATDEATDRGATRLVGRQSALRFLQKSYHNLLLSGGHTEFLLVQGEAGVGKSCLLEYFLHSYDLTESNIFRTTCYPSEINSPLAPWHTISVALAEQVDSMALPAYHKAVSSLFPAFPFEETGGNSFKKQGNEGDEAQKQGQNAITMLLSKVVSNRPTLLIFEDIHWMDPQSAHLLSVLLRRLQRKKLLILTTSRPGLPDYIASVLSHALEDGLLSTHLMENLTPEESQDFIRRATDQQYSKEDVAQIHENTLGNPLLLQQLLNALDHQEDISLSSQEAQHIISRRLSLLPLDLTYLLDVISLFPNPVPLNLLCGVMEKSSAEVWGLGEQLVAQQMIHRVGEGKNVIFAMAHQRIEEILRGQQAPVNRRLLHLKVANYLVTETPTISQLEQLVYHFTQGGDHFAAFAHKVEAFHLYTQLCYELFPMVNNVADAHIPEEKNLIGLVAGLEEEFNNYYRSGLEGERLGELERMFLQAKGRFFIQKGMYHLGIPAIESLIQFSTKVGDILSLAQAHRQMTYYAIQRFHLDLMGAHVDRGLELAIAHNDPLELANLYRLKGYYHILRGEQKDGREQLRRSLALLEEESHALEGRYQMATAGAHYYLGESYRLERKFEQAYQEFEITLVLNQSNEFLPSTAVFYTSYGQAAYQNGDFKRSRRLFQRACSIYVRSRESSWYPVALAYGARFDVEDGDYPQAAEKLQNAQGIASSMDSPLWQGLVLHVVVGIRLFLQQKGEESPCLEQLWQEDLFTQCQQAAALIPSVPYQWEHEKIQEVLEYIGKIG